jgi:hypothetical protein
VIGVFSFEATRANTARDELRSATESASLAAAAALAGSDNTDPALAHLNAINAAHEAFNQNSVVGFPLATAGTAANNAHVPSAESSSLFIEFLDPNNNNQPTAAPTYLNGTTVHVVGAYNLPPAFQFIGFTFPIRAESIGRTPPLDLIVCFDCSSSIDDQTKVTFVRRRWNSSLPGVRGGTGQIVYEVVNAPANSAQLAVSPRAAGKIFDIVTPKPTGTGLNGGWPQSLSTAGQEDTPLTFNPQLRNGGAGTDNNVPPGNYPGGGNSWGPTDFTDMVVNLDVKNDFAGITYDGYDFPDLATLVEAARGNLENSTVFANSKADTAVPLSVAPRAGYMAAYQRGMRQFAEPIGSAKTAALRFFQIMKTNTNAHFGFVSFNENAHTTVGDTKNSANISGNYAAGGNSDFPEPGIRLSTTQSNFDEITNTATGILHKCLANGQTNLGDSLQAGVDMLTSNASRVEAKRAIILFTDGMRTTGPNPTAAANNAKNANKGIAIYTIGLAQNQQIIQEEVDTLNDGGSGTVYSYSDPQTGNPGTCTAGRDGVSKIAGNGGRFFLVTNSANLNYVFENIARQLVQLTQQ